LGVVCRELLAWHVGVSLGGWLGWLAGGVGQAGVWGGAICHGLGGGALHRGWATTSRDVVGRGRLLCVGGSVVACGLEPSG
jgi:hypothetical protein